MESRHLKFELNEDIKEKILKSGICSLDIEYNPDYFYNDPEFKENFWGTGLSYYVGEEIEAFWIRDRDTIQSLLDFLTENSIPIVGHFFQSDITGFLAAGFTFKKDPIAYCTLIAVNFLNEELSDGQTGLKTLVGKLLGKERTSFLENCGYGPESPEFELYAKDDVIDQLSLFKILQEQLEKEDLWDAYAIVTASVVPFGEMAFTGMPFDPDAAEDLYYKYSILEEELIENIYKHIGRINLNSPKQLSKRLFSEGKYHCPGLAVTEGGDYSTNFQNIEKLAEKYPVFELLSAKRTCSKAINTYLENFVSMYSKYGRVFDTYLLHSATGRTRTRVLQLLPKDPGDKIIHNQSLKDALSDLKMRKVFKASPGKVLISADLSSAEYRYAAVSSQDKKMIEMYKYYECKECGHTGSSGHVLRVCPKCGHSGSNFSQGRDLHAFMRDVSNRNGANIDRNRAKGVSFCIIFNGTPNKLMTILNLPYNNCKKIQTALLNEFKGINEWQQEVRNLIDNRPLLKSPSGKTYTNPYCEVRDIFGRRRRVNMEERLRKGADNTVWVKKEAANQLINFKCQSPTCIHVQIALKNFRRRMIDEGLWGKVKVINMVHDQIDVECDEDIANEIAEKLRFEMENAVDIGIPTPSDCSIARNYVDCK